MLSFKKWAIVILAIGMLTACKENPAETIYQHLEAAVELESPFEQQQEPLQKAEMTENELFDEIIALGLSDYDEIVTLADKAIASIESREVMVIKEKESIEESYKEFKQIEEQIENMNEDEKLVDLMESLSDSMQERYEGYNNLHDIYMKTIAEDRALFKLLKTEELSIEELQFQIDVVNELYIKVEKKKEEFNNATDNYNQQKRRFYEAAGLNVLFE